MRVRRKIAIGMVVVSLGFGATGCGSKGNASPKGTIRVVAAENEYGNVASQIGGQYVTTASVESNPNTDPHTYEVSPEVASEVADAQIVIQNGVGYDSYMTKIENASPSSVRKVINVQHLRGLSNTTPNPHLWYTPKTMPAVVTALTAELSAMQPSHAAYFEANKKKFMTSLKPWLEAIANFKAKYAGTMAATTEPVADYLLQAMGVDNVTPWVFQADIMNTTDPSPQNVSLEDGFFTKHQVKVFCYNQQVVDQLTTSVRQTAEGAGVPVVGVYETMPVPGYSYESWMLAETLDIQKAVVSGISTEHL